VAFPAGIGFIDHPNSPRASAKGKSMTDQSNPRSQPVRMGQAEPSIEDQIRERVNSDQVARQEQPAPSMATERPHEPLTPVAPQSEIEQRMHQSIDAVHSSVAKELDELIAEIVEFRTMMHVGAGTVKKHLGHYLTLGETSLELKQHVRDRLKAIRAVLIHPEQ
jgi:hypothetical protein